MSYRYWNPNPNRQNNNGDCVIRAISKIMRRSWNQVYIDLCIQGYVQKDWGNSNSVWDSYLRDNGFIRKVVPNTCPKCYTVKDFCHDNPMVGEMVMIFGLSFYSLHCSQVGEMALETETGMLVM